METQRKWASVSKFVSKRNAIFQWLRESVSECFRVSVDKETKGVCFHPLETLFRPPWRPLSPSL